VYISEIPTKLYIKNYIDENLTKLDLQKFYYEILQSNYMLRNVKVKTYIDEQLDKVLLTKVDIKNFIVV